MDFEQIKEAVDLLEKRDGFAPADLLEFPAPVVATLRFLMGKRNRGVSALASRFKLDQSQVIVLLQALAQKGLVVESDTNSDGALMFVANLK